MLSLRLQGQTVPAITALDQVECGVAEVSLFFSIFFSPQLSCSFWQLKQVE